MKHIGHPKDFWSGLLFVGIGAFALIYGTKYTIGTAARMGPGYFPTILSYLIIAIGLVLATKGLATDGPPIERFSFRPLFAILAAILAFGFLIDRIGLALTAALLTIGSAYARRDVDLKETLLLAAGLALFVVGVFVYGLTQPLPAWWGR